MHTHPLFDGAFECLLPSNVIDASDLRQIPDNQEVFVHPSNNQSICVDILEAVDTSDCETAIRLHFDEISLSNQSSESIINSINISNLINPDSYCSSVVLLNGQQKVTKFNQTEEDIVAIYMGLYRYTQFQADVLLLVNDPIEQHSHVAPVSASGHHMPDQFETRSNGTNIVGLWTRDIVENILVSLRLRNPQIFSL